MGSVCRKDAGKIYIYILKYGGSYFFKQDPLEKEKEECPFFTSFKSSIFPIICSNFKNWFILLV